MLDYKLTVTEDNLGDFYAQEKCAVTILAINLKNQKNSTNTPGVN